MQQQTLLAILEKIEVESFLRPTFNASGYQAVADDLGATPEVQTLLAYQDASLPLMRARYRELAASMPDTARLVYFVVFGLARDRQMIREIVSYLKQCRVLPIEKLTSPWLAFLHGVHALELITGGQVQAPNSGGSGKQFDKFLTQVEKWAKSNS